MFNRIGADMPKVYADPRPCAALHANGARIDRRVTPSGPQAHGSACTVFHPLIVTPPRCSCRFLHDAHALCLRVFRVTQDA